MALVPEARGDLAGVGRYLAANLVFLNFLEPTLPGIFEGNALPEVNGALWTLKVEVMFYACVPLLAWALGSSESRSRRGLVLILVIYVAAEAWRAGLGWYATTGVGGIWSRLPHQLPGQMSFFVAGIALLRYRRALLTHPMALLVLSAGLTMASLQAPFHPLRAAGLAGLVLWAAHAAPVHVPAARFGDLSYGVYILHCPIIQTLVALGLFTASPWLGSAVVVASVSVAALALWWMVEKPALRRDSHYRMAAG
jgi:peptidoglycan/LPS O-acetylase OafA/YrhL